MKLADVRKNAFAMPLNNPAFPRGPYKFYNREFIVISYRTDPDIVRALVPEPLEPIGDTVNYEFIRMPDFDRFRRLHRNWAGYSCALQGLRRRSPGGRLCARDVPGRQRADRRAPGNLGLPEERSDPS